MSFVVYPSFNVEMEKAENPLLTIILLKQFGFVKNLGPLNQMNLDNRIDWCISLFETTHIAHSS